MERFLSVNINIRGWCIFRWCVWTLMLGVGGLTSEFPLSLTVSRELQASDASESSMGVTICSDAGAGGYEAFPDVVRLTDGRLFCAFYAGYSHVAFPCDQLPKGGRIVGCYSEDEGATWSTPRTVVDTPLDDRDPSLLQSPDGRLICNFFTHSPGNLHRDSYLVESTDAGQTWAEPRLLYENFPCSSPIRILSTGRWILGFYEGAGKSYAAVGWSDDAGQTWSPLVKIPCERKVDESDLIELADGSLYLLQRDWMGVSRSTDGGETWCDSSDVGFAGHCPYLLRVPQTAKAADAAKTAETAKSNGASVILLGTRLPKTMIRYSRDECASWSEAIEVDSCTGAYPSMVPLRDGSILIVYYEEGVGSNIRAKKFRVTETGIDWLTF